MNAHPLHLIGSRAGQDRFADKVEIDFDKAPIYRAHEDISVRDGLEDNNAAERQGYRECNLCVRPARKANCRSASVKSTGLPNSRCSQLAA